MALNSIATTTIISMIANLSRRANQLEAMLQGAPISALRIGNATITSAKIADLSITTASIENGAITDAKIVSLSATKVTAGTIDADRIGANTITAGKLSVSTLSAISANLGTLTAGSIDGITITGEYVRTSSSGDRVVIDTGGNLSLYSGGNPILNLIPTTDSGFIGGAGLGFFEFGSSSESGSYRGVAGINSGETDLIIGTQNTPLLLIQALNDGAINVETNSGDVRFECATFKINGSTKTAIVPTSKGYKALYCVESPEVWFFDIVENGSVDPLFLEVTGGEMKTITNRDGQILVLRRRIGYGTVRMELKTKDQYISNNRLWQN